MIVDLLRVVLMDEDTPFDFDIGVIDGRGVRALADRRRAANIIIIINILSNCSRVRYQIYW